MFTPAALEIVQEVLELFAQTGKIPIGIYEFSDGAMVEVARSGEVNFPAHCHKIWTINNERGREACNENMCVRAEVVFNSGKAQRLLCHAGLTTMATPIIVDNRVLAVIQYGAYVVSGKTNVQESIESHQRAMEIIGASKEEAASLKHLLLKGTQKGRASRLKWLDETLPPIITRIFERYVHYSKQINEIQQMAYHDVQMQLQAALARAGNFQRALRSESHFAANPSLNEKARNIVNAIEAAGMVMHSLMKGKYLPDKYLFQPRPVQDFVANAVRLFRPQAQKKRINIVFDIEPDGRPISIEASELHLQQAFNNLIQNAIKYSYRGHSTSRQNAHRRTYRFVSIRGRLAMENGNDGYRISIGNYGVGIEPEEHELIFGEGYQGKLTRAEYRSGSGQGLALVKRIIEQHSGSVKVSSDPVAETTEDDSVPYHTRFSVWLPLKQNTNGTDA